MGAGWQNPRPAAAERDIERRHEQELETLVEREREWRSAVPRRHRFRALLSRSRQEA